MKKKKCVHRFSFKVFFFFLSFTSIIGCVVNQKILCFLLYSFILCNRLYHNMCTIPYLYKQYKQQRSCPQKGTHQIITNLCFNLVSEPLYLKQFLLSSSWPGRLCLFCDLKFVLIFFSLPHTIMCLLIILCWNCWSPLYRRPLFFFYCC